MQRKALIIDDDIFCLDIVGEYLLDQEFDITSSLKPICPMIEQNINTCPMQAPCYDIVLSDNHMPEMTGLEFFELQRQGGCKVPPEHKALISGDISREEQKIAKDRGYKVFHKPTPLNPIDSWLDEVLDNHVQSLYSADQKPHFQ
ncbi:MAG: response regulator [Desulfuromusa sp.]|nr:response regulator [Desulfuromusa sp.]